jgi:hypothetical protein
MYLLVAATARERGDEPNTITFPPPGVLPMRAFAAVALLASVSLAADPPARPLPDKALTDGWVALFDGESTFGWAGKGEGDVSAKGGTLTVSGTAAVSTVVSFPAGVVSVVENGKTTEVKHGGGPFTLSAAGTARAISRVAYKPADAKPIFNGKDLTGWKAYKGDEKREKSKFEVTADGELRLTNGPGDLQTEGKYADFVLQLECKVNGDGLNGGVFFRCIDGQYQNGYEMQIQNVYTDNDRTKPKDFGTGAIYRRQPARKVMANDREWTHLTLVAHGPTLATWVNGYPVLVWTDERPKNANPRQGLRLDAGHLSLQGHDPTTDLLFRNIRIAEVKK